MKALILTCVALLIGSSARAYDQHRTCQDFQRVGEKAAGVLNDIKPNMDKTKQDLEKARMRLAEAQRKLKAAQARLNAATTDDQRSDAQREVQAAQLEVNMNKSSVDSLTTGASDGDSVYRRAANVLAKAREGGQALECPISVSAPSAAFQTVSAQDSGTSAPNNMGCPAGMHNEITHTWGQPYKCVPDNNAGAANDVTCPSGFHPVGHGKCMRDQTGGGTRSDNPADYFRSHRGGH